MAQQFQQGMGMPQQQDHFDPMMNMNVVMPAVPDAGAFQNEAWASPMQQQQAAMHMARQQNEMEKAFIAQQQQQQQAGGAPQTMLAGPNMASVMAMASLPGMMMNVPHTQFQSTFNMSQQTASPITQASQNMPKTDDNWINQLAEQNWNQNFDDVQQFVQPGEEVKTVEQKTKESEFYGFMDQIRDKRVLIDEENGKLIEGPGPDPEVEGDTEHLRQWAAMEGLNMPASVFEKPKTAPQEQVSGTRVDGDIGLAAALHNTAAPTAMEADVHEADMDALYDDNSDQWAEHFAQMQEKYEQAMNSTDYPFEENNPYKYVENPLEEGKEMLQLSNLAEAALAFEAVCQKHNDHKEAWVLLGKAQAENEKDNLAIIALNNARRVDPKDVQVHAALAVSHTNEQNVNPAMECMKMWLANHPQYQVLGNMNIEPDPEQDLFEEYSSVDPTKLREIVTLYTAAVEMNPNDPELHSNLGVVYNLAHNFEEAANCFRAAALLRPHDATLWNRLGASLANGGKGPDALEAYKKALDINPGYVRAMYNMAVSQSNLGMNEAAAKTIVRALGIQRGTTDPTRKGTSESQNLWDLLRMCLNMMQRQDLVEATYRENIEEFATLL